MIFMKKYKTCSYHSYFMARDINYWKSLPGAKIFTVGRHRHEDTNWT